MKWNPSKFRDFAAFLFVAVVAAVHAQSTAPASGSTSKTGMFSMDVAPQAPAVSEINGSLDYVGGEMNSAEGHNISGSITFPLGHSFGFQADALYSRISGLDFYGAAGHLFWRKPDTGLLGITGGYLYRTGVDTYQVGAEGEYYWDRFTFGAFAGFGSISYAYSAPFIDTNPNRFVGRVSVDYYALDNLRLGVAGESAFEDSLGRVDAEYQTPIRGLAFTAEAAYGDHAYHEWLLGARYYFGGNKTLRDRQRQDDPPGMMQQILHGLGVYGAEYDRKANAYAAASSNGSGSGVTLTLGGPTQWGGGSPPTFTGTPFNPPFTPAPIQSSSSSSGVSGSIGVPFPSGGGTPVQVPPNSGTILSDGGRYYGP